MERSRKWSCVEKWDGDFSDDSSSRDTGLIPAQGTEIPHPLWCSQRERKWMNMNMAISLSHRALVVMVEASSNQLCLATFCPWHFCPMSFGLSSGPLGVLRQTFKSTTQPHPPTSPASIQQKRLMTVQWGSRWVRTLVLWSVPYKMVWDQKGLKISEYCTTLRSFKHTST